MNKTSFKYCKICNKLLKYSQFKHNQNYCSILCRNKDKSIVLKRETTFLKKYRCKTCITN